MPRSALPTFVALVAGLVVVEVSGVVEYVAMAPGSGPQASGKPIVKWTKLTYEPTATSVDSVTFELVTAPVPELGAWYVAASGSSPSRPFVVAGVASN